MTLYAKLADIQQHQLNLQRWNQHHADKAWEQHQTPPAQPYQVGWDDWMLDAEPYWGENLREIT
jgi:hypothetical protein